MMRKKQFYIPVSLSERFDRVNQALVDEILDFRENFPNDGEAYAVGKANGKYFFAWGAEYPFADEVPSFNISDGESGIEWHESKESAFDAMENAIKAWDTKRSEEHTSELQSRENLVCRLLLEEENTMRHSV